MRQRKEQNLTSICCDRQTKTEKTAFNSDDLLENRISFDDLKTEMKNSATFVLYIYHVKIRINSLFAVNNIISCSHIKLTLKIVANSMSIHGTASIKYSIINI